MSRRHERAGEGAPASNSLWAFCLHVVLLVIGIAIPIWGVVLAYLRIARGRHWLEPVLLAAFGLIFGLSLMLRQANWFRKSPRQSIVGREEINDLRSRVFHTPTEDTANGPERRNKP